MLQLESSFEIELEAELPAAVQALPAGGLRRDRWSRRDQHRDTRGIRRTV